MDLASLPMSPEQAAEVLALIAQPEDEEDGQRVAGS